MLVVGWVPYTFTVSKHQVKEAFFSNPYIEKKAGIIIFKRLCQRGFMLKKRFFNKEISVRMCLAYNNNPVMFASWLGIKRSRCLTPAQDYVESDGRGVGERSQKNQVVQI
jgi:hypothetical protein